MTVALALLISTGCVDSAVVAGCPPSAGGLPVVSSAGEGIWARNGQTPRLVELWRAGGLAEGEELAYPVSLSASAEGRVAIADFQLSEVVVVEADGTWRGRWARRGRGPGELGTPVAASWDRNGMLAVFDITAPKVLFLADGEGPKEDVPVEPSFTAPIVLSGELTWAGVQPDGGVLLQPSPTPIEGAGTPGQRRVLLLRLPPGAAAPDTLARATLHGLSAGSYTGWPAPGRPRLLAAVAGDGTIAIGGTDASYRITIHDPVGRPLRQLCRDVPPLPITDAERRAEADADLPQELIAAVRDAPLPDTLAAFGRIFWGARGRLWVQRSRRPVLHESYLGVPGAAYDAFDQEGRYLGEVTAPPRALLQSAAGDTLWGIEFGELDQASVVAYGLILD